MSIFDWLRGGAAPKPVATEPAADAAALRDEIADYARREVRAGYATADEIAQGIVDIFETDEAVAIARSTVQREIETIRTEQASWPAVTDYDRLAAAFAALEESGIVARENFTCCGTCGSAEIGDEVGDIEARGQRARGYAFFHMQDTESAVDGCGLYLNYGSFEGGEADAVAVGHEVVGALRRSGLTPDWDGSHARRIGLPIDWKRRLPS